MLSNVRDFGAKGNGNDNDSLAIQSAVDDAISNNTGGIFFPAGTYRVSRLPDKRSSIDLNGVQDFMVMGEGPKSVVKLLDRADPEKPKDESKGDWHVFVLCNNCQKVVFKDLVIDGNRPRLTTFVGEQYQGIEVDPGTEDLVVDRCILRECFGDGLRTVGKRLRHVKRIRIENCLFQRNKRSGMSIQHGSEKIIIANCIFDANEDDNTIDIESGGTDFPTQITIQGCIINHTNIAKAVSLFPQLDAGHLVSCKFTDNIVVGGPIFCGKFSQLIIQNNIVLVMDPRIKPTPDPDFRRIPIEVAHGGDSVMISGNLVENRTRGDAAISVKGVPTHPTSLALVTNNLCFVRAGSGIECLAINDAAIQGNMIVATAPGNHGILARATENPMDHISVRDNDITVKGSGKWMFGVHIAATEKHHIGDVSVVGNSIRRAKTGVAFEAPSGAFEKPHFTRTPVCALNRTAADVATPLDGIKFLPEKSLVGGGATSRGGTTGAGRLIAGLGDPNKTEDAVGVTGNVGDIFQRLDGKPGKTFYVKETGNNTATGWKEK